MGISCAVVEACASPHASTVDTEDACWAADPVGVVAASVAVVVLQDDDDAEVEDSTP